MFAGYLFLRFKDCCEIRQINPLQTLMNLQYVGQHCSEGELCGFCCGLCEEFKGFLHFQCLFKTPGRLIFTEVYNGRRSSQRGRFNPPPGLNPGLTQV